MLDPDGDVHSAGRSRSTPATSCLLYTDGLAEARAGEQLFGEERIANTLRRDPGRRPRRAVQVAARGGPRLRHASPITDDVAILAIRRTWA